MKKMKNLHLQVRWVYEWQHNPYDHVDEQKKRPLLIWTNMSKFLQHKMLCFYCSKSIDKSNPRSCVLIRKELNPAFKFNTYVWLHKPIVVENVDVIPKGWKEIKDLETRIRIEKKAKEIYIDLLTIKNG